jgi:hypothetical protein
VKGAIEGVIMSDVTGEPVAGAEVRLGLFVGWSSMPSSPGFSEFTPTAPKASVITTADGRYSFKEITAGTYRILAAANGFIRQEYGQKTPYGVGTPFTSPKARL